MAITVADKENTLLGEIVDILKAVKIGTANAFTAVHRDDSTDETEQKRLTKSGGVSIIYEDTEEYGLPDLAVGCVLSITLSVFTNQGDITKLVNAAKNALKSNPPPSSKAFAATDELFRQVTFGEIKKDTDQKPWVIAELPAKIAFVISDDVSH